MAIGDSAGMLFKIRADNADATRAIAQTKGDITGLGAAATGTGSAFSAFAVPAALAGTAILSIGTAAATAAIKLFDLTKSSAEYAGAIFDAAQKTGLATKTISALSFAAQQSGSSLEQITDSVAKFNVLLGQAQLGNVKADKTLTDLGITARDTDTALAQAITTIAGMSDANKQAAATALLFKDRTGDVLNTIREMKGDLPGTIKELERIGAVMSKQDARAADEFGDTLDKLSNQATNIAAQFTLAFAPEITRAMNAVSEALANNKDAVKEWGDYVADILRGTESAFSIYFSDVTAGARTFGLNFLKALDPPIIGLTHVLSLLQQVGAAQRANDPLKAAIGGSVNIGGGYTPPVPRSGGGGSARDTGEDDAKRAAAEAERARRDAVQAAEDTVQDTLQVYAAGNKERIAQLDQDLALGLITEKEHIRNVGKVRIDAIKDEQRQTESLLRNDKIVLNDEEKAEILQKLKVLVIELRVERLKGATEITEQIKAETAAENALLEKEKERLEVLRKMKNERDKRAANVALDEKKAELDRLQAERIATQGIGTGGDFSTQKLLEQFEGNQAAIAGIETLRSAFEGLGQAIGQAAAAWVLYGSAGTSARKVTAQILAALAQQAAVKAIFELAEGFAALARAFFGDPKAGAEAAMHFKSAATYAVVAGIAAVAGRGAAGNEFNAQGGSGAGAGGRQQQQEQQNNYTTRFRGLRDEEGGTVFQRLERAIERNTMVLAQSEETNNALATRLTTFSPDDVVAMGAEGAKSDLRNAIQSDLSDNPQATGGYMRGFGQAR